MGDCIYCSKPAGIFRKKHKECEAKFLEEKRLKEQKIDAEKNDLLALATAAATGQGSIEAVSAKVKSASEFIDDVTSKGLLVQAWESAVDKCLDDNLLSKEEESKLVDFTKAFALTQNDCDKKGAYTRVGQVGILRDIAEGKIPERVSIVGSLPFNFKKNEKLVWLFKGVQYYEQKTRREFVGGSHGVSVRIVRGVYYRVGAFKGHPVEKTETVHLDTGMLGLTNEHIYFSGSAKSFRVPYDKIVTITPYSDGFGIQKDAATAKPQSFVVGDGWFVNNLIASLSKA
jgi:hypothetical protein